jgi:hypothetical protein
LSRATVRDATSSVSVGGWGVTAGLPADEAVARTAAGAVIALRNSSGAYDHAHDFFNDAFIYQNGTFQDLNNLIPAGSGWELTDAVAVNDNGQILVDATSTTSGQDHALLLTPTS